MEINNSHDNDAVPGTKFVPPRYLAWMYAVDRIGVEGRGIERVEPEERQDNVCMKQFISVIGLWFAGCGGITTMSSFFLPTILFGLNMKQSMISGLIGMNLGCLVPAYCSVMGPKSGCRQMVTARFLFGHWGVKFVSIIVILGGIGWSVVNCVVGGQMLQAVSGNTVSLALGIVIVFLGSLIVGIFGIRVLLRFQGIVAIPTNIAILLYYIVVCKQTKWIPESNKAVAELGYNPLTVTGHWLSYFTIAYSCTATWGSCASDYYILFPAHTSGKKVFWVTFFGIAIPSNFAAIVGIIAGNISYSYGPWTEAYNDFGIGGLINVAFKPWGGFGKFVVVLLYISVICNTLMNTYSAAFEVQLISTKLAIVPRWIWATLISVIYLVLSLAGQSHLSTVIGNVLPMLGYWITIYITLLLEENLIFRNTVTKKLHFKEFEGQADFASLEDDIEKISPTLTNTKSVDSSESVTLSLYNWSNWDQPKKISAGYAAAIAFVAGAVGAAMGMNQVYYIGPISKKIGDSGGDIGMWLCAAFSGVVYPVLRYFELKRWGR
ncbi:hypothetical protein PUMCH_001735 [Australozyma saopauloensis]|uniref:Vitamin B6 transporter n=1 Tax=Australozyma saopauloensis TaxID=291208 RepID=A0AAX4H7A1_9ASCO|nr:hypothetical protein PUMCH_001735 [[Candida] saopauloensis]